MSHWITPRNIYRESQLGWLLDKEERERKGKKERVGEREGEKEREGNKTSMEEFDMAGNMWVTLPVDDACPIGSDH